MTTNTNAALRSAAESALEALEILNGIDTETESVTIHVSDEIAALRAALTTAAPQPCDIIADAVRVPLDSLHADAEWLCARLLDKSLTREEVVTAIRSRIDAAKAALTTAAAVPAPVVGEKFQRAWIQLDQLPGTMMVGPEGRFGPIPASTSAWITTSEEERDRCLSAGKPMLEMWLAAAPKAAQAQAAVAGLGQETCQSCQGNGEIVTNWERYKHPSPGDRGDEAVAECQDCDGRGVVDAAPTTQAAPVAQGDARAGKFMTVVYRDISPGEEARALCEHPKASAMSWSHALNERDAARAAVQASRAAHPAAPVAQGDGAEPVAYLWQHSETGRTRVVMPDAVITTDASWRVIGPLFLAARSQAKEGA